MDDLRLSLLIETAVKGLADVESLIGQIKELGGDATEAEAKAKGLADELKHLDDANAAARRGAAGVNELTAAIKGAVQQAVAMFGAWQAFEALKGVVEDVFKTGGSFEMLGAQLETVMKSSEGAKAAMDWIKQFAKDTPLEVEGVSKAFITLKNFGLDPMDGTMQAIADQSSTLGGKQETLERIVLALGQAWGRQALQGQDILQMIEAGVPVYDLLEKATGKNTAELQKMSEAGTLTRDVMTELIAEMEKANQGASVRAMQTWNGQISNLHDNWQAFLNLVASSGALDYLKGQLSAVNAAVSEMAKTGELKAWAKEASDAITGMAKAIKEGIVFVHDNAEALKLLGEVAVGLKLGAVAADVGAMTAALVGSTAATNAAAAAATRFSVALRGMGYLALAVEVGSLAKNLWDLAAQEDKNDATTKAVARSHESLATSLKLARDAGSAYADMEIKTAAQRASLSAQEADAYDAQLAKAQKYWLAVATQQDIEKKDSTEAVARADAYGAALSRTGEAGETAGTAIDDGMKKAVDATKTYGAALDKAATSTGNAGTELRKMVLEFDLMKPDNVESLAIAVETLGDKSELAAKEVKEGLLAQMEKLSGSALQAALDNVRGKLGEVGTNATGLQTILDAGVAVAFKRVGLDANEVLVGVDNKTRDAIAAMKGLGSTLEASGIKGAAAADIIRRGWTNVIDAAKTTSDLGEIDAALTQMGKDGQIGFSELVAAHGQVAEAQRKLGISTAEIRAAQEAAAASAAKSSEENRKLAAMEANLKAAQDAGKASAEQLAAVETERAKATEAAATASKDSAEALRLQSAAASDAAAEISKAAAEITAREEAVSLATQANSQAYKEAAQAAREKAAADKEAEQAAKGAANAADAEGVALTRLYDPLEVAINTVKQYSESLGKLYETVTMRGGGGFMAWEQAIEEVSAALERLKEKKAHVDDLTSRINAAVASGKDLAWAAQQSTVGFGELDAQHLTGLQAAIDSAKAKLQELEATAKSTKDTILDELDQLEGKQTEIEQRSYENRKAELEASLKAAGEAQDSKAQADYQTSLNALERIHAIKMEQYREEEAAQKQSSANSTADTGKTTTINFVGSDGQKVSGKFAESDAANLVKVLKNSGLRMVA